MKETEADVPAELVAPLPPEQLSPAVQKLLAGAGAAKTMAARGMAPLRPADLAVALYQLSFDADPTVASAAQAAPQNVPEALLLSLVKEPLPAAVLHHLGTRIPEQRAAALEALLYNPHTADATFGALAARLPERFLDIIFENETRLLRTPAIVKALFGNKAARMSSVNRALELCARNGVAVDVPGFEEMVQEIRQSPEAVQATADQVFAQLAEATASLQAELPPVEAGDEGTPALVGADDGPTEETVRKEAPAAASDDKRKSAVIDFSKLKIYEKIRLATFGNSYCRANLIRDSNRLVAMAVIKSPMITDSEVISAAGNKAVHEDVIRYIANSRDFTKLYATRWALVNNPKCPLTMAMRFLSTLSKNDLKKVAKSKNVPAAISTTARRLVGNAQA